MAMVVAVVPPTVSGGSPYYAKEALQLQKKAFHSFLTAVLSNDDGVTKVRDNSNDSGDNRDPECEIEVQYQEKREGNVDEGVADKKSNCNYGRYDEAKDLIEQAKEKRLLAKIVGMYTGVQLRNTYRRERTEQKVLPILVNPRMAKRAGGMVVGVSART